LLEGKKVNLKTMEKEDLPLFWTWFNDPEVFGEFNPLHQACKEEIERLLVSPLEWRGFLIEKKDGGKVGFIAHFYVLHPVGKQLEVGYSLIPSERGKGYGTEALKIMVDYLFLSHEAVRIQAQTDTRNAISQKVLQKAGFKMEGVIRQAIFSRGQWRDANMFSILRQEWEHPRVLTQ
jgi:RimJ/RimL family protein N-acetyltransferase